MRPTLLRLAESISSRPLNIRDVSTQLYAPMPLLRRLLRAHRNLPLAMRSLGDDYVKSEFRRHRDTTNPLHIIGFLSQWKIYLEQLPTSKDGGQFKGTKLDTAVFEKMSSEQIGQLYELMHAAKGIWNPVAEASGEEQRESSR